tara:strand:+ start:5964 stop:7121 length:1158 start_codon:yes stop_codon:yes gene_type:complete
MSLGKNKSAMNMQFVPQNNLFGGGLTDEQRRQLGMPTFNMNNAVMNTTPVKSVLPKKEPVVTPKLATDIPKFSGFGNKLAQMGGFNKILGQKDLSAMTQEEVNKYEADRLQSRNRGTQDLLMALGSAFKGEDIVGNVQNLRDRRNTADDLQAQEELNKQIAEAYANGDYDLVNQLMIEKGDGAGIQAISNRINKARPEVSSDGKFRLEYDEKGNVINMTPIQENIDALSNKTDLSFSEKKEIKADQRKMDTMKVQVADIEGFEKMIENDELDFGFFEGIGDALGQEGFPGFKDDQESRNSRDFQNWRNELVNKALSMQSGTKTDFDWVAVAQSLQSANSKKGVLQFLKRYKKGLLEEQKITQDGLDIISDGKGVGDDDFEFEIRE